jgi:hypothetical protein
MQVVVLEHDLPQTGIFLPLIITIIITNHQRIPQSKTLLIAGPTGLGWMAD